MKLVSAMMPTRERPLWALDALGYFLQQTYPMKELIVLDDADAPSFPDGIPIGYTLLEAVHYERLPERLRIAEKRNRAAAMAHGDVIMHFDSDDWSAPGRMMDEIQRLETTGLAVTGYSAMHFYHEERGQWLYYTGPSSYAIGTSLAYTRAFWQAHPFNETLATEEDNAFVYAARREDQLVSVSAGGFMAARIHAGNTDPKRLHGFHPATPCPRAFERLVMA
jgi:glycosyltransferase involved in cell wall biosynthesis